MRRWKSSRALPPLVLLLFVAAGADVFTSTAQLSNILGAEIEVVGLLDNYIRQTQSQLNKLQRYVKEFESIVSERETIWVESVVDNPLHVYQLIKRLTHRWKDVLEVHDHFKSWDEVFKKISSIKSRFVSPTLDDFQGSAEALVRLQEFYGLTASDLVRGKIMNIESMVKLTAADCLHLGRTSFSKEFLNLAIEWFEHGSRLAEQDSDVAAYNDNAKYLEEAKTKFVKMATRGGKKEESKDTDSSPNMFNFLGVNITEAEVESNFRALCRNEKLLPPNVEKQLLCFMSTQNDPYFVLHPLKTEEHFLDPPIRSFHDVLNDNEIMHLKRMASPFLTRADVLDEDGVTRYVSPDRTSQKMFFHDQTLDDDGRQILFKVTQRIEKITKLNILGSSEAWQVANYGIGGHYALHYDYLFISKDPEEIAKLNKIHEGFGDRIATFMIYLSDVKLGGATSFPLLGTSIWPEKGKAVFWYNLRKSSQTDPLTLHGACPVIHGSKWVANHWIREVRQVFKRPCGLSEQE